jgi:aryl-alcohol dehydrogenase-like predicted oxidoreductase
MSGKPDPIDRRSFLRLGMLTAGAAVGGRALATETAPRSPEGEAEETAGGGMRYRPLGKTGLEVSEVAFGTYGFDNPALLSAALDAGINLVCTCADYQDGGAEESIGQAIGKLGGRRDDLVLFTGKKVRAGMTKQQVLEALDGSLKRLQTDRVEIFRTHNVGEPAELEVDVLFEAFEAAKQAGKALHLGLSGHRGGLQDCLNAAIANGRFEVFLCKYDFASYADQEAIVHRAAEQGIGTIAFKTNAGARQKEIKDLEAGGLSLDQASTKWALSNPDISSVCAGITSFDQIKEFCGAVGATLSAAEARMLRRYAAAVRDQYCRFCATCERTCPHGVAVADVMRYHMYFKYYGRQKDSMRLYRELPANRSAAACLDCDAPCQGSCPFDRRIRAGLLEAHELLSFA